MIRKKIIFLLLSVAVLAGCSQKQAVSDKPVITVTILPFEYFARQLAGDHFRINVLVPPGVSHHNYDPTPRQLQDLEKSGALFVNGQLGFEKAWIPKLKSNYHNLAIVDLSAGISLITEEGEASKPDVTGEPADHDHEGPDPHFWMSVTEARKIALTMSQGLIQADPACRQLIEKNLAILNTLLDSLDRSMAQSFKGLEHRSFLIFHPALTYLARDYGLSQHSMELAGKEPTASHFKELVDLARTEKINTIFVQREYDQENAETLARETGAKIIVIDPMSPDWLLEMKQLQDKIIAMDNRKPE